MYGKDILWRILKGTFEREPLKFHTKYFTHILKDTIFIHVCWNFKSSWILELEIVFEMPPR